MLTDGRNKKGRPSGLPLVSVKLALAGSQEPTAWLCGNPDYPTSVFGAGSNYFVPHILNGCENQVFVTLGAKVPNSETIRAAQVNGAKKPLPTRPGQGFLDSCRCIRILVLLCLIARCDHYLFHGGIMLDSSTPSARPQRVWRPTKSFWIVAAIVLLLVLSAAASGGFGSVLSVLGVVALFTGLYALLFKRRSWVGIPHRKSAALVAGAGVVAAFVGGGIVGATAAPGGSDVVAVSESSQSATATPTETSPGNAACVTEDESRTYRDEIFVCTVATDDKLVWLPEAESKELVAQKQEAAKAAAQKATAKAAAEKEAKAKAAAEKAAKAKAAAEKAAADKLAAEKAAAEKAAAEKIASDKAAAQQAAAEEAARQAVQAPAPVPAAPAAPAAGYVHPGSFCSGGTGVSKTGKPMVCAPGSDGRMRWQGA